MFRCCQDKCLDAGLADLVADQNTGCILRDAGGIKKLRPSADGPDCFSMAKLILQMFDCQTIYFSILGHASVAQNNGSIEDDAGLIFQ